MAKRKKSTRKKSTPSVSKVTVDLKKDLIEIQQSRSTGSRLSDESKTSKDTRAISQRNVLEWMKRKNRMDLVGIDTKKSKSERHELSKNLLAKRHKKSTKKKSTAKKTRSKK